MAILRATDFPTNKDLYMPGPAPLRKELDIQTKRLDRMKAVDEYIRENCNYLGEMNENQVLTDKEELGRKEILQGVKEKGWMVYNSDKS